MPKSIVDWFDINNPEHIAAYQFVCDKGYWPDGFIPDRHCVAFPAGWPALLAGTIAEQLLVQRQKLVVTLEGIESTLEPCLSDEIQGDLTVMERSILADVKRALAPLRKAKGRQP